MGANPNGKVFISYRREDAAGHAGRLYDRLKTRYPGRVFIDVGEIVPGSDFVEAIERSIGQCKVLVAIIGNGWLPGDRLRDPNDFVRLEIASALRRGIRVIPLLVRGSRMPAASNLPADLAALLRRQAISISDEAWDSDCERLIQVLAQDLGPAEEPRTARRLVGVLAVAAAIVLAVGGLLLRSYRATHSMPPGSSTATQTKAAEDYAKSLAKAFDAGTSQMDEIGRKIAGEDKAAPAKGPAQGSFSPLGKWALGARGGYMPPEPAWEFRADHQLVNARRQIVIGTWEYAAGGQTVIVKLSGHTLGPGEMQITSTGAGTMIGKGDDGSLWDFKSIQSH